MRMQDQSEVKQRWRIVCVEPKQRELLGDKPRREEEYNRVLEVLEDKTEREANVALSTWKAMFSIAKEITIKLERI